MKQQEKMILIKEIYKGLGVNTSVESMEIKAFDIYAKQQIKELSYFKHLQSEIEEAQMSVEKQKQQIKELKALNRKNRANEQPLPIICPTCKKVLPDSLSMQGQHYQEHITEFWAKINELIEAS